MSSIPNSPTLPVRNRRSVRLSSFEVQDPAQSPYTSGTTNGTTFSRRSSRTSQTSFMPSSPVTPRPTSARSSRPSSFYHHRKSSGRLSIGSNISLDAYEDGLGNLADELEDALEDDYEVNGSSFLDDTKDRTAEYTTSATQSPYIQRDPQSPTFAYNPSPVSTQQSPTRSKKQKTGHYRSESNTNGTQNGMEHEGENDGIPSSLARTMKDVESLVRQSLNLEDTIGEEGGIIRRTTNALKDLGSQAGIEASVSRVVSAYISMATHRTHKTRDVSSQTQSLLYRPVFDLPLPEDTIDALLSELETLSSLLSFSFPQHQNPLYSLQILAQHTLDLATTLRSLTDSLQESRIQANMAARKLKSVRDMVEDMCVEQDLVETSMMLIQAGDWDRRCRERQAARTCREVVLEFKDRWDVEADVDIDGRPWMRERDSGVS